MLVAGTGYVQASDRDGGDRSHSLEKATMRVLGYFIGCCPAVLLLSVIIEKRNAEVEITYEVEIPHAQDELRPRVAAARVRMFSCILRLG